MKCSVSFGEPQAGKARLIPAKSAVSAPVRQARFRFPMKIEAIFIGNRNYT
jgi:hypothetical protein